MMKKTCFVALLALFSFSAAFAQFNDEKLQKDLEKMEEQFQDIFKDFGVDFESGIFVDTFFFKNLEDFQPGHGLQFFMEEGLQDLQLNDMLDLMEQGMGQMESLDFSEFEKMFESFGLDPGTLIPAPDNLPQEDGTPFKKKNKRKSYSL